jgi:hypothetical protein
MDHSRSTASASMSTREYLTHFGVKFVVLALFYPLITFFISFGIISNALWCQCNPFDEADFNSVFHLLHEVAGGLRPRIADDCPPAIKSLITKCWKGVSRNGPC